MTDDLDGTGFGDTFFDDTVDPADAIPTHAETKEVCAHGYRAQYEATLDIIDAGRTERSVDELIDDLLVRAQAGIDQSPGKAGRDCRSGCAFCCYSSVEIHPLEAIAVARHLQRTVTAEELAAIEQRLRERVRKKRAMTATEYKRTSIACGLLKEDNTCGVYAARPLACRGYNSLSVQKCEEAYNHPAAPNTAPFDYHAKVWVVAIGNGMMDAHRARGLDAKGYELNSAVLCALTTPQAATKWINGQDIFKDCLIDRANQRQAPPAPQQAGPAAVRQGAAAQGTVGQGAVGQGAVGQGTVGQGTVGQGTVGQGTVGQGTVGQGTVGQGTVGQGTVGQGTVGQGTVGQGTVGRNDPCPCGSGKKYKKCCLLKR